MGKYSIRMVIISCIVGIIYGFLGEVIYGALQGILPRIIVTMIYFGGLFVTVMLGLYLGGRTFSRRQSGKINIKKVLLLFVILLISSVLFEFIYDLVHKEQSGAADSYIFLIDASGSMEQSDPDGLRFDAMEQLLSTKKNDFEYAIYMFNEKPMLYRDMQPVSTPMGDIDIESEGGTGIMAVVGQVLDDIDGGKLKLKGTTRVILLSDGEATDIDLFTKHSFIKMLDGFADRGIAISTVGLLYADDNLMEMIAEKTNGNYVNVQDAYQLGDAIETAGNAGATLRDLLSYRMGSSLNILLAILRIIFVVILGMIIAVAKTEMCEDFLDTRSVLYSSAVGGTLAGLAIELGMNAFGISPMLIRCLVCLLIAITLLKVSPDGLSDEYTSAKSAS